MSGGERPGVAFVVAAPSGTGKTTVCRRLHDADPRLDFSVSHTTRPPRRTEVDGVDYHFVSTRVFRERARRGAFLEWAEYNDNHYGTSWEAVQGPLARGRDVLLEIEVQGARQVRQRLPEARLIFLLPPSMAELEARLRGRGANSESEVAARLETARQELQALPEFDYAVVNDDLDACVARVAEIVAAERAGARTEVRRRYDPASAAKRLAADVR